MELTFTLSVVSVGTVSLSWIETPTSMRRFEPDAVCEMVRPEAACAQPDEVVSTVTPLQLPPPPHGASLVPADTKRWGRYWLLYPVWIHPSDRAMLEILTSSRVPRKGSPQLSWVS